MQIKFSRSFKSFSMLLIYIMLHCVSYVNCLKKMHLRYHVHKLNKLILNNVFIGGLGNCILTRFAYQHKFLLYIFIEMKNIKSRSLLVKC